MIVLLLLQTHFRVKKFNPKLMSLLLISWHDALPSSLLDPLEGLNMWNCEKMEFEGHSRLSALKGVRGAC
jgi:hypothetical protein